MGFCGKRTITVSSELQYQVRDTLKGAVEMAVVDVLKLMASTTGS
jgi:hypothetical protein